MKKSDHMKIIGWILVLLGIGGMLLDLVIVWMLLFSVAAGFLIVADYYNAKEYKRLKTRLDSEPTNHNSKS